MSTIVSEFTTQLTISSSMPGVIAIGFLIALLLEIEIIRAFKKDLIQPGIHVLAAAIVPLILVFLTWMMVRIIDLVY
jgi:mannose/fructose/N-acetylgalactosamine-specific phosphotransferase system component IID